jgi:hypothetical protein
LREGLDIAPLFEAASEVFCPSCRRRITSFFRRSFELELQSAVGAHALPLRLTN